MYLYVKTHKTGLKYLGKTNQDPYKYRGSGTYWRRHLDKYGDDHSTEILLETDDKELFKKTALYYSDLWNIVESDEWANLVPEQGDGGDTSSSENYQAYIKTVDRRGENNTFFGKTHSEESKSLMKEKKDGQGKGIPKNHGHKIKAFWEGKEHANRGKTPWNKGKKGVQTKSLETKKKISKPVVYNGVEYYSISEAARANNTSTWYITKQLRGDTSTSRRCKHSPK